MGFYSLDNWWIAIELPRGLRIWLILQPTVGTRGYQWIELIYPLNPKLTVLFLISCFWFLIPAWMTSNSSNLPNPRKMTNYRRQIFKIYQTEYHHFMLSDLYHLLSFPKPPNFSRVSIPKRMCSRAESRDFGIASRFYHFPHTNWFPIAPKKITNKSVAKSNKP